MEINNVGYKFTHGTNFCINRPKGSGDYAILFLRTGAFFTIDGRETEAVPQSFIMYKKGTPQFFRANGDVFINDWLHFDLTPSEEIEIERMGVPFDTPVALGDITFFSKTIKSMYQEKYSIGAYKNKTLELYFKLIMIKLSERINSYGTQAESPYYERLAALRADIYNKPDKERSVDSMAQSLSLSSSYFQHLYKRLFDVSVVSDIINARVERAQYLLSSTDYNISRIAVECGYKNDVHFMRQFKKEVGVTPSKYRKENGISFCQKEKRFQKAPFFIPQNS